MKVDKDIFLPANALIRDLSKSLEEEFPPSYSYSSTISCCKVGSHLTMLMSVVILRLYALENKK